LNFNSKQKAGGIEFPPAFYFSVIKMPEKGFKKDKTIYVNLVIPGDIRTIPGNGTDSFGYI